MSDHHITLKTHAAQNQTTQVQTLKIQTVPKILRAFLYLDKPYYVKSEAALQSLFSVLEQHNIELQVADPECAIVHHFEDEPIVYVSAGGVAADFKVLYDLPLSFRKRWFYRIYWFHRSFRKRWRTRYQG
jgi:hypothetical protein